jgi:hypothetical protein
MQPIRLGLVGYGKLLRTNTFQQSMPTPRSNWCLSPRKGSLAPA